MSRKAGQCISQTHLHICSYSCVGTERHQHCTGTRHAASFATCMPLGSLHIMYAVAQVCCCIFERGFKLGKGLEDAVL